MVKLFVFIGVLSLVLFSCGIFDDKLSLEKRPFDGRQLRIDGYYYTSWNVGEKERYDTYFLYRNGVLLNGASFLKEDKLKKEQEFKDGTYHKRSDVKYTWGVFDIVGDSIVFERWYPSEKPHRAYIRAGKILNDTTFIITESYRMRFDRKTSHREREEVYHFRELSPKPDSTNRFVD